MQEESISAIDQFVIDQVRRIRVEKGVSQAQLALLLDKSKGFIGNVENPKERAKYNLTMLNEIAKALECSIRDFMPDPFV